MPTLLCFGFGFTAAVLVRSLRKNDKRSWDIRGTVRTPQKMKTLEAIGVEPFLFDGSAALSKKAFENVTHILSSVPPSSSQNWDHDTLVDPVIRTHSDRSGQSLCRDTVSWIGYLSSTGVYGNHNGAMVTENTPITLKTTDPSYSRVRAEQEWLSLKKGTGIAPVHIFRLSGIYGPGRNALDSVRQGKAQRIIKPGHVFCRIHVDDIAATLCASLKTPTPGRIYNVADNEPAPYADVISYACQILNVPPPPEVHWNQANLSPMLANFYANCRRVDNTRLKSELGVTLNFPTYRHGLRNIFETETAQTTETNGV